ELSFARGIAVGVLGMKRGRVAVVRADLLVDGDAREGLMDVVGDSAGHVARGGGPRGVGADEAACGGVESALGVEDGAGLAAGGMEVVSAEDIVDACVEQALRGDTEELGEFAQG